MQKIILLLAFLLMFLHGSGQVQDCILGVGGKDMEVIIQVFQLSPEQQEKLNVWIGELEAFNKLKGDEIRQLFDTHPQKTDKDLITLANKYMALKDEMLAMSKLYDQKLLATFNQKQYQRYADLCTEVYRKPMPIVLENPDSRQPEK